MGTPFNAVERNDRSSDGDPSWRDDPSVRNLMLVGNPEGAVQERSFHTFVLLNGAVATVPMSRWEALDAGYAVLDDDLGPDTQRDSVAEPADEPVVDEPVVDEPVVDEPVVDEPVVDLDDFMADLGPDAVVEISDFELATEPTEVDEFEAEPAEGEPLARFEPDQPPAERALPEAVALVVLEEVGEVERAAPQQVDRVAAESVEGPVRSAPSQTYPVEIGVIEAVAPDETGLIEAVAPVKTEPVPDPATGRGPVSARPALAPAPLSHLPSDVNDWLRAVSRAARSASSPPASRLTEPEMHPAAAVEPPQPTIELVAADTAAESDAPVLIKARRITKRYPGPNGVVHALVDVDIEIRQGELIAVSGPSGSGKTSLLYCLSGLDDIDSGEVVVAGEAMHLLSDAEKTALRARTMGFIFQTYHLVEHMSAVENVEMPLLLSGWDPSEARREALTGLDDVGLSARVDHLPGELSGGEQQRVTVARALVGDPQIVWADEPTGNLDDDTATTVIDLLRARNATGLTVVLVTHDAALAATATRRVELGAGRLVTVLPTAG